MVMWLLKLLCVDKVECTGANNKIVQGKVYFSRKGIYFLVRFVGWLGDLFPVRGRGFLPSEGEGEEIAFSG